MIERIKGKGPKSVLGQEGGGGQVDASCGGTAHAYALFIKQPSANHRPSLRREEAQSLPDCGCPEKRPKWSTHSIASKTSYLNHATPTRSPVGVKEVAAVGPCPFASCHEVTGADPEICGVC